MSIDFQGDRWATVQAVHRQWWRGELERPLVPLVVRDRAPTRPKPDVPLLSQATCTDLTIPAEALIDRIDYELSSCTYLGDAFPRWDMACFGPGVLAAFLGARIDNSTGRVWFHADVERDVRDLRLQFDPDNAWFRRVCDIYRAGMRRWQGQVLMGMVDMGGTLDVISTFRPGEKLLLDLYDDPDEVKRLVREVHDAWHQAYNALNEILQPVNPGYSDWSGIYSDQPSYILQSDFCYMIGPDMFECFAKPELAESCGKVTNAFYHLDGVGQLPHLDSILAIDTLQGVQWVPGEGNPDCSHWPDIYRRIRNSKKLIQLYGGFAVLDEVISQLGSGRGIHLLHAAVPDQTSAREKLANYGIE